MQLGMIGLGRMGGNMVVRLSRAGHECVVADRDDAVKQQIVKESGGKAVASTSAKDLISKLKPPRALWLMVPAGIVDRVIADYAPLLSKDDVLIDGGNSCYIDDIRRSQGAGRQGRPLPRRRHVRRRLGPGPRLLHDDRRRRGGREAARPDLQGPRARQGPDAGHHGQGPQRQGRADRRVPHRPGHGGRWLPPLRPLGRRPLRQDGPQRHRVRPHGRLRRGPQRPQARQRRQAGPRPRQRRGLAAAAARALPVRFQPARDRRSCGGAAASWRRGCST